MPKSKGRKPPKQSPQPRHTTPQPKMWVRISRWLFATTLAVCTIVGGLIAFLPRLTVDPEGPLDPSRPYPISFRIVNAGLVPLRNVRPMLGVCLLFAGPPRAMPDQCPGNLTSRLARPAWAVKWLSMDEKHVIDLGDMLNFGTNFGGADISIVVSYEPWIVPITREIEFRFFTKKTDEGKLVWLPRPVAK